MLRSVHRRMSAVARAAIALGVALSGCDAAPSASVVLDNAYPPSSTLPLVVYRASWQAVPFPAPVLPADFITQLVFPADFAALRYDAATCTTIPVADGGTP